MIIRNCLTCGSEFKVYPSWLELGKGLTCSLKCNGLKVRKLNKESKNKIYADCIELFVNNPNLSQLDIANKIGCKNWDVYVAICKYFEKPPYTIMLNSEIDSDRAIEQELQYSEFKTVQLCANY